MSEGFNRSDIVDFFLVEASEHLQILNDGLLSLEENSDDLSVVDEIFRSAHTIKGSAAMLGFNVISKLAHKMEDLLGKIRSQDIELSESVIDLLLNSVDTLTNQVETIPSGEVEDESLLLMFNDLYAEYLSPAGPRETPSPQPSPLPAEEKEEEEVECGLSEDELDLPEDALDALAELDEIPFEDDESPEESPESLDYFSEQSEAPSLEKEIEGERHKTKVSASPTPKSSDESPSRPTPQLTTPQRSMVSASDKKIVKVEVEGLDLLMNLVGELVINRTRLDQRIMYVNKLSSELHLSRERLLKSVRDFKEKYEFGQLNSEPVSNTVYTREAPVGNETIEFLDDFFELEFDKYDDFNILSRSLVEIGTDISEVMNQLTEFFDQFEEESSQIRRITDELQEEITNIRMVPVGQLFNRFHRTVRDVAKQESKTVSLHISGEEAKLDKTVINEIADPLMHMIRNSVSHGIETPDIREAKGKPREGTVALNAFKEGDHIIIEISDDGNGIDVQKIRESIAEKGLCSMAEAEQMPDDKAIKYIFAPGLSTQRNVSAVSGRGVGMDVVKTNIAKLGGVIDIKTESGKGSKFSIKLPLTLVISAALLLRSGNQEFAISLTSVEETARIPAHHIHRIGSQEVIKLRDQVLPIRRLNNILQYHSDNGSSSLQQYIPIVIVRSAENFLALIVDELIGQETIVIKPLGDYLKKVHLFSGATISGEGKVRLILDISAIIEQELLSERASQMTSATIELYDNGFEDAISQPERKAIPELLLIDDSISIRKMIGMLLSKAGYQVDAAADGVEATEKIAERSYDLIITDLEMPRMHGYELIAEIRSNPALNPVPIVVMTSRAGEKHHAKALELGADDYIVKPVEEETLLQSVKNLLARQGVGMES